MTVEKLLYRVREAGGTLACADSVHCSSPADCLRWAAEDIAGANQTLAAGPMAATIPGRGRVQITRVTDAAMLTVVLASGETTTVSAVEVTA